MASGSGASKSHDPKFLVRNRTCSAWPKFLVPEQSGTRMHGRRAKFLVPEFGSCAVGLSQCFESKIAFCYIMYIQFRQLS